MLTLFVRRHSPEKMKHLRGLVRAGIYLGALGLVFGAVQVRSARAEVKNRTVEMGRQMLQLAKATQHDVNKINFNGQTMYVGSSLADDTPKGVLDRYESYCQQNLAQPAEQWRTLATKPGEKPPEKTLLGGGVMRTGTDEEGAVVCFTKAANSKPSTTEALKTFAETGELGALGGLRYVYVHKTQKGNTTVLTAWTDDQFNLAKLMPEENKDCGGSDFNGIPRIPNSQRVLSAIVDGTPFGLNLYRGGESPEKVVEWIDGEMHARGWYVLDPELKDHTEVDPKNPPVGRLYEKDGVVLTVAASKDEYGVMTGFGLAGTVANDGTKSADGRKAVDMSPSERARNAGENASSNASKATSESASNASTATP